MKSVSASKSSLFIALVTLFCVQPSFAVTSSNEGLPHPAAFLCQKLGGETVNYSSPNGDGNLCNLKGALVDPMTLWYYLNNGHELAVDTFLNHPDQHPVLRANPASAYCKQVGGEHLSVTLNDGARLGVCQFNENGHLSSIEQWTLFFGPKAAKNARLMEVLSDKSLSE